MDWKQQLRALHLAYLKAKSPDFFSLSGGDKMKLKPHNDNSTPSLCNAVYAWLKYSNYEVERCASKGKTMVLLTDIKGVFVTFFIEKSHPMIKACTEITLNVRSKQTKNGGPLIVRIGSMPALVDWLQSFEHSIKNKAFQTLLFP